MATRTRVVRSLRSFAAIIRSEIDLWDEDPGNPKKHDNLGRVSLAWTAMLRADVICLPLTDPFAAKAAADAAAAAAKAAAKGDKGKPAKKEKGPPPVSGVLEVRESGRGEANPTNLNRHHHSPAGGGGVT